MLTGTNLVYTKQYNLRIVHEAIRLHGPLSRADIARRTALTGQTISNLVRELLASGLVYEVERRKEGRGAPSTTLAINPDGAFSIGIDFNRDHLTGALVDLAGSVRQRATVEVDFPTPEQVLALTVEMVDALLARQGIRRDRLRGVGVGVPGPMRHAENGEGYVVSPKAFPGWHDVPFASWLHAELGVPVLLENNATAAALGERWYGAGQQIATFFYLFLGSGLGGGLVVNGQPFTGFTGNAGEIGYLPTSLAGDADDGAHVGQHFNLPRLYERLRGAGLIARTPEDLDRLFVAGHPALAAWMDTAAEHLAGVVLAIEYLVDPEAIVYGGRLSERMIAALMGGVAARLPARRISEKVSGPRHLLATAGADAAALGVATLPIYEFFAPSSQVLLKQGREPRAAGMQPSRERARG